MATWEDVLIKCHQNYLITHPNSNEKIKPAHEWIKEKLEEELGPDYVVSTEYIIKGKFYDKRVDVVILKKGLPKGVVSFKFVSSNYSQNSNNYFENLIGECYNIQMNKIPFCHVLVIRKNMPYFEDGGTFRKLEIISKEHLIKYLSLSKAKGYGSPKMISISIVHIEGDSKNEEIIHSTKFRKNYDLQSEKEKKKLLDPISVEISCPDDFEDIQDELNKLEINKVLREFANIVKRRGLFNF